VALRLDSGTWFPLLGFTITLRNTHTLGKFRLDELSACRRELYLTTHNTYKKQTFLTPAGFEPTIPTSERLQTHSLDRGATGTGKMKYAC